MRKRAVVWLLAGAALAGCDAADDVRVLPLPSLEAASPETRAGLPTISGVWRFAGWELAPGDTGRVSDELPAFGDVRIETQRLDSLAGSYMVGEGRLPLVGEVRRDSVLTLAGGGRFLAGRVANDTFWISLTSLLEPGSWPGEARAAFVRSDVTSRFVRVQGQRTVLAQADSVVTDTLQVAAGEPDTTVRTGPFPVRSGLPLTPGRTVAAGEPETTARTGPFPVRSGLPLTPGRTAQRRPVETAPRRATPEAPRPQRAEEAAQQEPQQERQEAPQPEVEPEPAPEPDPEPARPRRSRPQLLGVPVDSLYSPTAARAMSRPGAVSASR